MNTVVCFGDGITAHETSEDGSLRLTSRVRYALDDWSVINAGVSRETTRVALTRFQEDVLRHEPDLVTILFGANDACQQSLIEREEYRNNLEYMIEKLGGHKVLLLSPSPVIEKLQYTRCNDLLKEYADVVQQLALQYNTHFIDLWGEMKKRKYEKLLIEDGLHLNRRGYKLVAELVIHTMSKLPVQKHTRSLHQL
ncbi:lipase/acylhydrolase domain-containing protein [Fictibacillus macauensis ZFHKF-1]|uniref:Lipase/acylhydrolase domain-containing protein n=1 Tax=Fictibacillus macauensis ZFHKF-1 TaxID=1196324 RepID=I8AG13_9BACL|nr:GDSL-type esterase/lipase family protein [Fictibacillus macauensis]EIT84567.1 lipase/acylhydrolase domain-containing protein [Fictibacillus macauensis ZFHKF-1]